jgi:two-component system, OmpR family, response regulator VanR
MKAIKKAKILYIDDEDFIRSNVIEYLAFYCDNVYEAKNGIEGYEIYEKIKPDIIITDIKMPKLNGLELIEKIRIKDKITNIIIVTAFLDTNYLLKAVELGLIKYIIKPITEDKIIPALKSCLSISKEFNNIYRINEEISYDKFNQTLFFKNKIIELRRKELLFLDLLIKNSNRVVRYDELNSFIWEGEMSEDALRSVVKELRRKVSKNSIKNISGIGYKIDSAI